MKPLRPSHVMSGSCFPVEHRWTFAFLFVLCFFTGCKQDPVPEPSPTNKIESLVPAPSPTDTNKLSTEQKHEPQSTPPRTPSPTGAEPKAPTAQSSIPKQKRDASQYTEARLNKNNTLLVLAFQPDIRADYVISNSRTVIDAQQLARAKKLALTYDKRFVEIRRHRAAILESATSDQDIEGQLLEIRMDIADLIGKIRTHISQEILTEDQRIQSRQNYLDEIERLKSLKKSKTTKTPPENKTQ